MDTQKKINFQVFALKQADTQADANVREALKALPRLAKLASKETGWPVLGTLTVRATNADRFKRINAQVDRDNNNTNLNQINGNPLDGHISSQMEQSQAMAEDGHAFFSTATATMPDQIVLNIDNIRQRKMTADDIKSTLLHELIHYAQSQNNHELFKTIGVLQASASKAEYVFGRNSKEARKLNNAVDLRLQRLEGQATYIQEKFDKQQPNSALNTNLRQAKFRHNHSTPESAQQALFYAKYVKGSESYEQAHKQGQKASVFLNPKLSQGEMRTMDKIENHSISQSKLLKIKEVSARIKQWFSDFNCAKSYDMRSNYYDNGLLSPHHTTEYFHQLAKDACADLDRRYNLKSLGF